MVVDRSVDYRSTHKVHFSEPPSTAGPSVPTRSIRFEATVTNTERVWDKELSEWVPGFDKRKRAFYASFYASGWDNSRFSRQTKQEWGLGGATLTSRTYGDHASLPAEMHVTALGSLGPMRDGSKIATRASQNNMDSSSEGIYRQPRLSAYLKRKYHNWPKLQNGEVQGRPATARPLVWAGTSVEKLVPDDSLTWNVRGRYNRNASNYEDTLEAQRAGLGMRRYMTTSKTSSEEMLRLVSSAREKGMFEMQKHGYAFPRKKRDDTQVSRDGPDFLYIPHVNVRNPEDALV